MRGLLLSGLTMFTAAAAFAAEPMPPRSAGDATAAQPPTSSTAPSDRVASPYWNGGNYTSDLPAADIRAVPPARAAAVQARWTYEQLSTDLNTATRILMLQLEGREDYRRAISDEKTAYDALESARRQALQPLQDNAAYIGNEKLRRDLTEQIQDAFAEVKPDEDRIQAMARLKLEYVASNRRLEQEALARDSAYQEARRKYVAVADQVSELRQAHAFTVATDDNLQSIRRQLAEAKIARVTTAAYLNSAVRARNIAIYYANNYRSYDRYHPVGYGYGYGYGGYYPYSHTTRYYTR